MLLARESELKQLQDLWSKNTASLVALTGRRRIGKSTLVENFGKSAAKFIRFQGLAPGKKITEKVQLENFAEELQISCGGPLLNLRNWNEAFMALDKVLTEKKTVLLLDEISWLAKDSPAFVGKLKNAWDGYFKKHDKLIVILCGSVSSWIEENILQKTDFVGRISLHMHIKEIPLNQVSPFWKKHEVSSFEKLKFLVISGGVPRYLEELVPRQSSESNLQRLAFTAGGFFVDEFEKIFNDTFEKRAPIYKKILRKLILRPLSFVEICKALKVDKNGAISKYIEDLVLSDFLSRDYVYTPDGKKTKFSRFRISDNYIRFYLKYLEPNLEKINSGLMQNISIESLPQWNQICGFQFETLILKNKATLIKILNVPEQEITSFSPYFQKRTSRISEACQIDLLMTTRFGNLYVCEIKMKKQIGVEVIEEVQTKIKALVRPSHTSIRPVLIYAGELSDEVLQADYFAHIINVNEWLK
ncbi:MAG TPA: ATP-binding protein [Pseudobdellovibrionaceae bacterium]|nr:ATP-binding protein [Pseudobdellovibrionaceae bacterium]